MRRLLLAGALGLALAGCAREPAQVKQVSVAQAAEHLKNGTATLLDANDEEYRSAVGVIPQAVLLTSFSEYDLKQLPADKTRPLVFYCTSRL